MKCSIQLFRCFCKFITLNNYIFIFLYRIIQVPQYNLSINCTKQHFYSSSFLRQLLRFSIPRMISIYIWIPIPLENIKNPITSSLKLARPLSKSIIHRKHAIGKNSPNIIGIFIISKIKNIISNGDEIKKRKNFLIFVTLFIFLSLNNFYKLFCEYFQRK